MRHSTLFRSFGVALLFGSSLMKAETANLNIPQGCSSDLVPFQDEVGRQLWGYKNAQEEIVIEPTYHSARPFCQGRAAVRRDQRWHFINPFGEDAFAARFDEALDFSEGYAPVRVDRRWTFVDRDGTLLCAPRFFRAKRFSGGLAPVMIVNGSGEIRAGYIAPQSCQNFVIPADFSDAQPFVGPIAAVRRVGSQNWTIINHQGTATLEEEIREFHPWGFVENTWLMRSSGGWLFLKTDGTSLTTTRWNLAVPFSQGFAAVSNGQKWGYINSDATWRIEPRYFAAGSFRRADPTSEPNATVQYYELRAGNRVASCYRISARINPDGAVQEIITSSLVGYMTSSRSAYLQNERARSVVLPEAPAQCDQI